MAARCGVKSTRVHTVDQTCCITGEKDKMETRVVKHCSSLLDHSVKVQSTSWQWRESGTDRPQRGEVVFRL